MWQWIQNNIQILFPIVFFGLSGLGWVLKKAQEHKENKRVEDARKRARLEALRTGRIDGQQRAPGASKSPVRPSPQAETPRQRLEDLARRRQQGQQQRTATQRTELEEQLRRRREAIDAQRKRQQQRQPAQARTPAQQRSGQQPSQRQAQQPKQPTQRTAVSPAQQPRRTGERRPVAPLPTMQPVQQSVITDVIAAKRAEEEKPMEAPIPVAGVGRRSAPITARGIDVRQALIMREILDRPVGLREPRDPGW